MLAEMVKKSELAKVGVRDPFEAHTGRPLAEHLDDYKRFLEAEGNTAGYVAQTCSRIRTILSGCRFAFVRDLDAGKVSEFLHSLRRDPARPELSADQDRFTKRELVEALGGRTPAQLARLMRREGLTAAGNGKARRYPRETVEALQAIYCRGIGISTSNGYLAAVKGFSNWLRERVGRDPFVSLSRLNAQTDVRHARRALAEEQLQSVLAATGDSQIKFMGLDGTDRMMIYAVAMTTGLRAHELSTVRPASFRLDEGDAQVEVQAAYSKNRRKAEQPLPPDIAVALRPYLANRAQNKPVWAGLWWQNAAEMLRRDLEPAGIPYRDPDGRVADFHALRHSYITLLSSSGVHPKVAQELARHSDIRLTMQTYTHARLHDLAGAVAGLPSLLPEKADGASPVCRRFARTNDPSRESLIPDERTGRSKRKPVQERKSLESKAVEAG
jgi:integrase/recombinase XerC